VLRRARANCVRCSRLRWQETAMDFTFSKEHQFLRKMIREFVRREIAPIAADIDEHELVAIDAVRKAGALGLLGLPFAREYGGAGAGEIGYCILAEEISRACSGTMAVIGAHVGIGTMAIYLDGTAEQKAKYLPPLCRGEHLAAFALTEPQAGSDAGAIRTRAVRDGNHFVLNGSKIWITNGGIAEVICVFAVTDPALGVRGGVTAFIVEKDYPGFKVGAVDDKMGIRGSNTAELVFEDCRVPAANVLGAFGAGFVTAMRTLDVGRVTIGAAALGGAEAALDASLAFACEREQFGGPIAQKQSIQFMLVDMAAEIEALRSLVYRVAWMVDSHQPFSREAAMLKYYGSEVASRCVDRAVQIHGSTGLLRGVNVERGYRDARISEIFEGTNEICRIVVASDLLRKAGVRISS
jgi:alkylation response protein AidB-like acyl-CoA dehydrogenase